MLSDYVDRTVDIDNVENIDSVDEKIQGVNDYCISHCDNIPQTSRHSSKRVQNRQKQNVTEMKCKPQFGKPEPGTCKYHTYDDI